jgi:hypothetical protein
MLNWLITNAILPFTFTLPHTAVSLSFFEPASGSVSVEGSGSGTDKCIVVHSRGILFEYPELGFMWSF